MKLLHSYILYVEYDEEREVPTGEEIQKAVQEALEGIGLSGTIESPR